MATTSDVFGDLPEPATGYVVKDGIKTITEPDFHHGMPRPGERIRILARTYEDARVAHRNMQDRGPGVSGMFIYIGVAQQMRGLRECRIFAVPGWSRLMDAPMIEQLAKGGRVEIVNYEVQ